MQYANSETQMDQTTRSKLRQTDNIGNRRPCFEQAKASISNQRSFTRTKARLHR